MPGLPLPLAKIAADSVIDLRDARDGEVRRGLAAVLFAVPVIVAVVAYASVADGFRPSQLFPGAAIFAGALMGTVSMLFTRVKDAATNPRPEIGRDPTYQASVVFRSALYSAQVALVINAVLLVGTLMPPDGSAMRIASSIAIGLFAHLGVKVSLLLAGLRAQMMDTAGSRTQHPVAGGHWRQTG